jgi:hypothetical protein
MSGRTSDALLKAIKAYWRGHRRIYALAAKYGVAPSTIYRHLRKMRRK